MTVGAVCPQSLIYWFHCVTRGLASGPSFKQQNIPTAFLLNMPYRINLRLPYKPLWCLQDFQIKSLTLSPCLMHYSNRLVMKSPHQHQQLLIRYIFFTIILTFNVTNRWFSQSQNIRISRTDKVVVTQKA